MLLEIVLSTMRATRPPSCSADTGDSLISLSSLFRRAARSTVTQLAQGLALGADLNVAGICTLQALAQVSGHNKVIAALDARMGEIYLAAYENIGGKWQTQIEPCLCKIEDAPLLDSSDWFGAGSGFAAHGAALGERYAGQLAGNDAQAAPQAAAVAQIAAVMFAAGQGVDAAQAMPLYLRDKVALKTCER